MQAKYRTICDILEGERPSQRPFDGRRLFDRLLKEVLASVALWDEQSWNLFQPFLEIKKENMSTVINFEKRDVVE